MEEAVPGEIDPRVRLLSALLLCALAVLPPGPVPATVLLVAGVVAAAVWGAGLGRVVRLVAAADVFVLLLWMTAAVEWRPGAGLSLSPEGVRYCLTVTVKVNASVLTCALLMASVPMEDLVHALHHLYVPRKMVMLVFLSYRYVHVLREEFERMNRAARVRGFVPRTGWHTCRTYASMLAGLFIRAYRRADRVFGAMRCRGFSGTFPLLYHFAMKRKDWYAAAAVGVLASVMLGGALWW